METLRIAAIVVVTASVASVITWYFGREERTRRAITRRPIVKVRDVTEGATVRVTGTLRLGASSIDAPFSHRACAHYDALVEERYVENRHESWHTVAHETSSCAFFIEDETGKIEVDATRIEGIVVRDHHKTKGQLDVDKARVFLAKHGQKTEITPGRVLRYREGVLEAGETVTVLGKARRESRDGTERLVIADGDAPVRASDDPELVR